MERTVNPVKMAPTNQRSILWAIFIDFLTFMAGEYSEGFTNMVVFLCRASMLHLHWLWYFCCSLPRLHVFIVQPVNQVLKAQEQHPKHNVVRCMHLWWSITKMWKEKNIICLVSTKTQFIDVPGTLFASLFYICEKKLENESLSLVFIQTVLLNEDFAHYFSFTLLTRLL